MQKGKASIELVLKGLSVFKTGMKGISTSMKTMETRAKTAGTRLKTLGSAMATMRTALIGGAAVMAARSFVQASNRQELAITKLNAALKKEGIFSEALSESLQILASRLQVLANEADEATLENIALMQNIGHLAEETIPAATKAAIGLSKIMGVDARTAFMLLGRAASGNTTLFTRYGITLDATLSDQEKFNQLLDMGAKGFALAEAETRTAAGQMKAFSLALGDLKEHLGRVLKEGLVPLVEMLTQSLRAFQALPAPIRDTSIAVGFLTVALVGLRKILILLGLKAGPAGWVVLGIGAIAAAFYALRTSIKTTREEAEKVTRITEANVKIAKSIVALSETYTRLAEAGYDALAGRWIDEASEKEAKLLMVSMKQWEKHGWSIERARQTLILFAEESKKTAKIAEELAKPIVPEVLEEPEEAKLQRMILLKDKYPALWAEMNAAIYGLEEEFLASNQAILDQLDAAKAQQFRTEYEYWQSTLQEMIAGYDTFWATILDKDMTGKERREAIWESMKRAFVARIAAMLKAEILSALTRESLEKRVTASVVAEHAKQVLSSLTSAAADMVKAVAAGFKWLVSKLGPFGLAAGIALGAGLIAAFSGFKRMLGFAKGGKVKEEVLAVLHPPEIVAPEKTFLDYSRSLLAKAGRRGLGAEESLSLLRQMNEGIQEMRSKEWSPVFENMLDGQTLYRKTIIPAEKLEERRKL